LLIDVLRRYFDFIQEKYKIREEIFDWFDFVLNAFALFGVLPGILLRYLHPKKAAIFGGILIVFAQMMTAIMVTTEHEKIRENPSYVLGSICVLAGQGSLLVLFACMQALMNLQTILSSHVIAACCVSYYLGADSFIVSVKDGLFKTITFSDFVMSLAIAAFILVILNAVIISDREDAGGIMGRSETLSKGIAYKKKNYGHLLILAVFTTMLVGADFSGAIKSRESAIGLIALVFANLLVPLVFLRLLSPERIKKLIGQPTEIEQKLAGKGDDMDFSQAAVRIDFWYMGIVTMIVIGASRLFNENAHYLGMMNDQRQLMVSETFQVYTVVGAFVTGALLTLFRALLQPSKVIVLLALAAGLGQLAMVWPQTFQD